MGSWAFSFAACALGYAALAMIVLLSVGRLFGWRAAPRMLPVIYITLVFVFMTQHPFPARDTLICPVPGTLPQLVPFGHGITVERLWSRAAPLVDWLTNRTIASAGMNFVICAVIGLASGWAGIRPPAALAFGILLTLAVELTQLTGLWGFYPCAYRQFDVNDLILNALGVLVGSVVWQLCRRTSSDPAARRKRAKG